MRYHTFFRCFYWIAAPKGLFTRSTEEICYYFDTLFPPKIMTSSFQQITPPNKQLQDLWVESVVSDNSVTLHKAHQGWRSRTVLCFPFPDKRRHYFVLPVPITDRGIYFKWLLPLRTSFSEICLKVQWVISDYHLTAPRFSWFSCSCLFGLKSKQLRASCSPCFWSC